jgi:hypothetical protein
MNYFEVYNFLDGNNLCNIFANLLVNKYEELSPNSKTEIKVINLRNFFVVRGVTSCEEVCNITELFQNFVSKFNSEITQDIRVINLMTHNPDFDFKTINISHSSDAYINNQTSEFTEFVNSFSSNNIYFNLKINTVTKHILYDCVDDSTAKVIDILENKFEDFQLLKYDMSNEIYFSDSFYGKSKTSRVYDILLKDVENHIFTLGLGKNFICNLSSSTDIKEIENINVSLNILNDNYIVNNNWLESLILDVFPFDNESLIDNYKELLSKDFDLMSNGKINFNKLNYISDFVLF